MDKKLGFIGLGTMGLPMAKNLLKKEGALLAADLVAEKKEEIKALGAEIAADNKEVAEKSDIIFLSLPTVKAVQFVMEDLLAAAEPGTWIVDTSTNGHQLCAELCKKAEEKGLYYVDAPVSGGAGKAADGTLSIIVGATEEEMEKEGIAPLLKDMAKKINYGGIRGAGVALKIINNMISKGIMYTVGEGVVMAEKLGIDFDILYDMVQSSSSGNEIFRIKKEHIQNHDYAPSSKSYAALGTITIKDMTLARELSDEIGVSAFAITNIIQWYKLAIAEGYGEQDASFIVEMLRKANAV